MLAQLTQRAQRLQDGEASLGWKLGMGVPAAMKKLGTDAPLVGYLLAGARVDDGGTVSLDGWGNAKLEPEIAVHMGADLAPGASREDAEAAIAGLGVAIELVDLDPDADDPEAILAADIFQRHVLLGPLVEGATAGGVSARVLQNGDEAAATADATEATGDPVDLALPRRDRRRRGRRDAARRRGGHLRLGRAGARRRAGRHGRGAARPAGDADRLLRLTPASECPRRV